MNSKNKYYEEKNVQKNLVEPKPTFKPQINKFKSQAAEVVQGAKRHDAILEKGKEYVEKKLVMQKMREE